MKKSLIFIIFLIFISSFLSSCKTEIVNYNKNNDSDASASADEENSDNLSDEDSSHLPDSLNDSDFSNDDDTNITPDEQSKPECGNSILENDEICEKSDKKNCTEISESYESGEAKCNNSCSGWDVSNCVEKEDAKPYCGDNIVNNSETCDGNSKPCIEIDSNEFISGTANCKSDCSGWETSSCEKKPVIEDSPIGKIDSVSIQTTYIFNSEKMSDSTYVYSKKNNFQKTPAGFAGTVNGTKFPYTENYFEPWTASIYDAANQKLKVFMASAKLMGLTYEAKDITVQLFMSTNGIEKKTYNIDFTTSDASQPKIVIFKEYETKKLCVLAVAAKGTITVENIPDTFAVDTFKNIQISGSNINLYAPTKAPYETSDISSVVSAMGLEVCK